jgi:shikimate dehydrogenase
MDKKSPARIYGVLGYPAKHSLSPLMHNAAFRALKIDAEYRIFEVEPEELNRFLERLDENNIFGLNVTVPYKERILDFVSLDFPLLHLRQVHAVNTIVKKDGIWKGFNTDIPGFSRHLKEKLNPYNKKVALIGAGGAARAVAYVLALSGAQEIAIFDIDKNKSLKVAEMIKELFPNFRIAPVKLIRDLNIRDKDLLINATPVGLKETDPCPIDEGELHKDLLVYDLIYNPLETKLLKAAKEAGAQISNGLDMLLYQGAFSFEIFTGAPAPIEIMRQALMEGVKKL